MMDFPLITKRQMQMTCNNADDKTSMKNDSSVKGQDKRSLDEQYLSTDIVKQVETWMKNQRFSEQYAPSSHRSQNSPILISERSSRKPKKRNVSKDGEYMIESSDVSMFHNTKSDIISTAESKQTTRKIFEPRERKNPINNVFKDPAATKINQGFNREPANRSFEKQNKNSRFGSIHDELEFRKRYKRISDLQSHLQFVNGSYLSGKNILTEQKKLAPVNNYKRYKKLETSDMFSLSPVEKQVAKNKRKNKNPPQEETRVFNKKPPLLWQKFQKLPSITPSSNTPKKAMSESNVKLENESERTASKMGYASSALQSHEEGKDERAKSVITNSSYGPYQEMKVTIHIRYKKNQVTPDVNSDDDYESETSSVASSGEITPRAYDGRIHAIPEDNKTSQQSNKSMLHKNENILTDNSVLPSISRTSNIPRKSTEQFPTYDGGTLPPLIVNSPMSKTPRLTISKILH